jgi:lysophospholipase L1-like esterase
MRLSSSIGLITDSRPPDGIHLDAAGHAIWDHAIWDKAALGGIQSVPEILLNRS